MARGFRGLLDNLLIVCAVFGLLGSGSIFLAAAEGGQNGRSRVFAPLFYATPEGWKEEVCDDPEYEFMLSTSARDTGDLFTIMARRLAVAGQDARKWAEDERFSLVASGYVVSSRVEQINIGDTVWYVLESTRPAAVKGASGPVMKTGRHYFSNAPGSDTFVEVVVLGDQGAFKGDFINELTDFLSTFSFGKKPGGNSGGDLEKEK